MLPEKDRVRLHHMLDATREVLGYSQGKFREDLDSDGMFLRAAVKCIEIVGEAAARTTEDTRRLFPSIPWAQICGMRNRLIHAYFDIDRDMVWETIQEDLPMIERMLEMILREDKG